MVVGDVVSVSFSGVVSLSVRETDVRNIIFMNCGGSVSTLNLN